MPTNDSVRDDEEFWLFNREEARKLEDEYLLGEVTGRSSLSTVYRCLRKGRTEWTCKVLEKGRLDKALAKSEIPKLMKLKHPNITRIKEAFEDEKNISLIVESVTGKEIFERIVEIGQYSERDAAKAVRDILQALQYLHSNGIVHGDIRPENLLYEADVPDARLKMTDFGLAGLLSDKNSGMGNGFGTSHRCNPEQVIGMEMDRSSDLWSLGAVTYMMLTGYEPRWGSVGNSDTRNSAEGWLSFSSPVWDDISDSAKELIAKLLNEDPSKRPTADEALKHPWTSGIASSPVPRVSMIKGLIEYNARRRFRVATKAVLAVTRAVHLATAGRENSKGSFINDVKHFSKLLGEMEKEPKAISHSPSDGTAE